MIADYSRVCGATKTDPKMPAHYIAQANWEKLGMSGMDKIATFDRSQNTDDFLPCPTRTEAQRTARTE